MIRRKGDILDKKQLRKLENSKRKLPKIIANQSLNHYLEGFRKGGGQTDASINGWKKRKLKLRDFASKGRKTRQRARRQKGRAILVDTGQLRNDLQVISRSRREIVLGTKRIPYAARHNEGLNMPKREFIGDSRELNEKNMKRITKELDKILL
jgi:phage gpG-like protein